MTMDDAKTNGALVQSVAKQPDRNGRRRRWEMSSQDVRFFLPKGGTSPERPELGQEAPNEGEALVQAFRSNQVFYTLVAWKAVPEFDGEETKIVKQVAARGGPTTRP
jgi:hypothetical protein